MRYAVVVLLLPGLAAQARAQENDAEKLYRDFEKKLKSAKAIHIKADIELRAMKAREGDSKIAKGVSPAKGDFLFTKDNEARLKLRNEFLALTVISDGKQLKLLGDQDELRDVEARPTPNHLYNLTRLLVSRGGVTACSIIIRFAPGPQFNPVFLSPSEPGEKPFNPETMEGWAVWGFKAGRPAQIGGRDAKVISYQVGPKGNRDAM